MKNFKYNKEELREILDLGLAHGADFSELFFEDTIDNAFSSTDGKVANVVTNSVHGVGIRLLKGTEVVFSYTNDFSKIKEEIIKLSETFGGERIANAKELKEVEKNNCVKEVIPHSSVSNEKKINLIYQAYEGAKSVSDEIVQVAIRYIDKEQNIIVANSDGVYAEDLRVNCRLYASAVASDGKEMHSSGADAGHNEGFEFFENFDAASVGAEAAKTAVTMLHADYIKGGKMTVVINNGFGGVILHEACVHSLEATSVAKNASVFCGKLGQKIASDIVTAVDDGTLDGYWGSLNVDDEGHKTQRNVLIENGILKSYLVDYRNARSMNHPTTGSGRRESYKYLPTSRMTNTFFVNGTSTFDEIIANTKYGLFAKKMGGGSVNPASGEFNFAVNEAYLIEDGKITKPIKGATLVGSGKDVLLNVDMIANNLLTGHGMCGSSSGSIPTDVGQPTIRVQNITVGGRD